MKKLITIILILALALPALALADLPDISGYTDQELKDLIAMCSAELATRHISEPEGILIFEYEGVKVYQTGDAYISSGFLRVPVAVYNDMEFSVSVTPANALCNGWDIWSSGCGASAKAKKKDTISFSVSDADVGSLEQIESFRFKWNVTNTDTFFYINKQEEYEEYRFW